MDNKRFALLIDADNISAKYIGSILEELSTYGITTYKRIYGGLDQHTSNQMEGRIIGKFRDSRAAIQQYSG